MVQISNLIQQLAYCLLGWIMAKAYNLLGRMMACCGVLPAEFQKLVSSITQLKTCRRGEGASYGCASIVNLSSENRKVKHFGRGDEMNLAQWRPSHEQHRSATALVETFTYHSTEVPWWAIALHRSEPRGGHLSRVRAFPN